MAIKPSAYIAPVVPASLPAAAGKTDGGEAGGGADRRKAERGERQQGYKQVSLDQRSKKQFGMKQQGLKQQALRQQAARHQSMVAGNAAAEDMSPAAREQNFNDAIDTMATLMGQFRSRRDFDKKSEEASSQFAQVLDDDGEGKARALIRIVKSSGLSTGELLQQARSLFPDVSDLILVLRELLRQRQLDAIVRARLEAALKQAEQEASPRALKAGINVALKARLFGAKLALSAALLRASYRQFLESEAGEVAIYEEWIMAYGHGRRALVLEFLESALVADMLAQDPSCSRIEFGNLLGKLNQLKLLRSTESLFIAGLLADALVAAHNGSEADWLAFMLALLQSPHELDALLMDVVGASLLPASHTVRAAVLQSVRYACSVLPHTLMTEEDAEQLRQRFDALTETVYGHELAARRRGNPDVQ